MPRPNHLRLLPTDADLRSRQQVVAWLLGSAPDPLPDDERLIRALDGAPPTRPRQLREVINQLVGDGRLHRVHIGNRRHLTRHGDSADPIRDEARFRLQVEHDLETEKQLLLKTVLVLEAIILLLIGRELILAWLAS